MIECFFYTFIKKEHVINNPIQYIRNYILVTLVKSVQSALSNLKRPPERLQSQCNYQPFIT